MIAIPGRFPSRDHIPALVLANAYPDLFAAIGVHSGLAVGAAQGKASAMMAMAQGNPGIRCTAPMPTIIFHGSDDRVVHARNGRFIAIRALEPFAGVRGTQLKRQVKGGRSYVKSTHRVGQGRPLVEHWLIEGSGHAWSGGSPAGRFVDPSGPDASREMVRFFLRHKKSLRKGSAASYDSTYRSQIQKMTSAARVMALRKMLPHCL